MARREKEKRMGQKSEVKESRYRATSLNGCHFSVSVRKDAQANE